MKPFSLPYGNTSLTFTLPESCQIEEILPHPYTMPVNIDQTIQAALKNPLGSSGLSHFPKDASVGIAINDKTRRYPSRIPSGISSKLSKRKVLTGKRSPCLSVPAPIRRCPKWNTHVCWPRISLRIIKSSSMIAIVLPWWIWGKQLTRRLS